MEINPNSKFLDPDISKVKLSHIKGINSDAYDFFVVMCLENTFCLNPAIVGTGSQSTLETNIWATSWGYSRRKHMYAERYAAACERLGGVKVGRIIEGEKVYYYFREMFIPSSDGENYSQRRTMDSFHSDLFNQTEEY
jgi:hypothetical protein